MEKYSLSFVCNNTKRVFLGKKYTTCRGLTLLYLGVAAAVNELENKSKSLNRQSKLLIFFSRLEFVKIYKEINFKREMEIYIFFSSHFKNL